MVGSLNPQTVAFTGDNKIRQGTTWRRQITFASAMTAYIGGLTRCQMFVGATEHFATHDGSLVLTWLAGDTVLEFKIPAATSTAKAGPLTGGTFEVEVVSSGGDPERPLTGTWEMDKELCVALT